MTKLVELNKTTHAHLKVVNNCVIKIAQSQHIINLRVTEVVKAVSSFPVFFNRHEHTGDWALSGVTSLEPGQNLFVHNDQWDATYLPTSMQTYPLFLMQTPEKERQYSFGIYAQNDAFSDKDGEALFDDKGKESLYLSKIKALLEDDIKNDIHTYQFSKQLHDLGLMKSIDVLVHYVDGKVNTLKGLFTVNEDKLQSLDAASFEELRQKGYLAPIYALLFSLYQLNALIRKHNATDGLTKVSQVKMEVTKDTL